MLSPESGRLVELDEKVSAFVTHERFSFHDAVRFMQATAGDGWHLASIAEIIEHEETLKKHMKECPTSEVWVSDRLELDCGQINIPKFYSCDMKLSKPKNGSIALHEEKCAVLLFRNQNA